jgi:hypothetical protein
MGIWESPYIEGTGDTSIPIVKMIYTLYNLENSSVWRSEETSDVVLNRNFDYEFFSRLQVSLLQLWETSMNCYWGLNDCHVFECVAPLFR